MSEPTASGNIQQLDHDLDLLVERAGRVLRKAYLPVRSRQVLCWTLTWLFLFALPGVGLELVRYLAGYSPFGLYWWQHGLLIVAAAGVFAASRLLPDYLRHTFARGSSLGLFDRQLGLANRLTTADEFMAAGERSAFMAAAIDDAAEPAQQALHSPLRAVATDRRWRLSRWSLLSVPGALAILLLTVWLGGLERPRADGRPGAGTPEDKQAGPEPALFARVAEGAAGETAASDNNALSSPDAEDGRAPANGETDDADDNPEPMADAAAGNRGGQPARSAQSERAAMHRSGAVPSGSGSEARAMAANSRQSSAGGRSTAVGQQHEQSSRDQHNAQLRTDRLEQQAAASAQERATGETVDSTRSGESGRTDSQGDSARSGSDGRSDSSREGERGADGSRQGEQGQRGPESGAASDRRSAAGDSPSRSQVGDQGEGRSSAKSEEQNSQGEGGQPGNRGAEAKGGEQGGGGSDGGEESIKKNRGAATAMLALPTGDRLIGSRGEGPEQVRQEQSAPEEAHGSPVATRARTERGDRIGTLQHASVSDWSRDLVKGYFDRLRGEASGDETESSNTTTDSGEGAR